MFCALMTRFAAMHASVHGLFHPEAMVSEFPCLRTSLKTNLFVP